MRTLMILGTILGVLSVYFIIDAEKSLIIKGNEVVPAGTDIPNLILNKAREIMPQLGIDNAKDFSNQATDIVKPIIKTEEIKKRASEMSGEVKNMISAAFGKIESSIKELIGNKIDETLCPQK